MEQTQLKWRPFSEKPSDDLLTDYEFMSSRGIFLCYFPTRSNADSLHQVIYHKESGWNFDGFTHWAPMPELPDHHEPKKVLERLLAYYAEDNATALRLFLNKVKDRSWLSTESVAALIEKEEAQAGSFITDVLMKENLIQSGDRYNRDSFRLTTRGSLLQELSKAVGKDNG